MNPEEMAKDMEDCAHALLSAAAAMREGDNKAVLEALSAALPFMAMQATTAAEAGLPVGYFTVTDDGSQGFVSLKDVQKKKVQ
jgi:hypothetical protein